MLSFSGLAMQVHYCMGHRVGVDFFENEHDNCGKCGMTDKNGCCHDDHKFYKLDQGHKYSQNTIHVEIPIRTIIYLYADWAIAPISLPICNNRQYNNGPPVYSGFDRCLLHCVFRL